MKHISKLALDDYDLIIFDWDGTLLNSAAMYPAWDRLYVRRFYGVDKPESYFRQLAAQLKQVNTHSTEESAYFRFLDVEFGDGTTDMQTIWRHVYSVATEIQGQIEYKSAAPQTLFAIRKKYPDAKLCLATNSEMRDLLFYSSTNSKTASLLNPIKFFDSVVALDHITKPKPHPETFTAVIDQYKIEPSRVLIFEDSFKGVRAAKSTGATVISVQDEMSDPDRIAIDKLADFSITDWNEVIRMLK